MKWCILVESIVNCQLSNSNSVVGKIDVSECQLSATVIHACFLRNPFKGIKTETWAGLRKYLERYAMK